MAVTVNVYSVPFVNPLTTAVVPAISDDPTALGVYATVYVKLSTVYPPAPLLVVLVPGTHVRFTFPDPIWTVPPVAVRVGAKGIVYGVADTDCADSLDSPFALRD